ncbi:CHAT domain-containing protein [Microbacterium invictum]|uniref:Tetratricopeptide (TPR) repeat protein n=1 Tax=Microbacterium invictum TaxID=515415 RepID=A0AA40VNA9_9MICO|nr:CHAT domain-containing protein [Microbacterium invictum]MBB4140208.1 tetratricopeptide (TPR) repeat protein [Microbacterium invictum]
MTLSAEELYTRGLEHVNAGRFGAARRALTSGAARAVDPDLRARIAGTRAFLASHDGAPDSAESLCRDALALDGISAQTTAILQGQLGLIALNRGNPSGAVSSLTSGIDAMPESSGRRARMYLNRSVAHMQLGELAAARGDLDRAIADYEEDADPDSAAVAEHNLGYILLLEGDLVGALGHMVSARKVMAGESDVHTAIGDVDRAEVLRDAGLTTEAERLLEAAIHVFGARRMRQAQAESELNLARSLLRHDPARAAKVAAAAERRFSQLEGALWRARAAGIRARALLAGGTVDRSGRVTPAARRVPDADTVGGLAAELDGHGLWGDAMALRLTHILWRVRHGRDDGTPLPRLRRSAPLEVRLLAYEVRAARAATPTQARRAAARGLDELTTWSHSFGSLDLQTSLAMHGNGLLGAGLAAAVDTGDPAAMFEWSERARLLSQQVVPLRPPPDPELARRLAELRTLRAELPADSWLSDPRAAELGELVRERQWASVAATDAPDGGDRVDLSGLQRLLDADTAALSFVFSPHGMRCVVAGAGCAEVVDLPGWSEAHTLLPGLRSDLDLSASVRSGPMADVIRRSLDARLASLSRLLLEPVTARTAARRLLITTPGVLAGVPWSMLPDLRGRVTTHAVSASRWARRRTPLTLRTAGFAVGPRVARGIEEVTTAASAWQRTQPEIRHGADSTIDGVTGMVGAVDVLHISAHGRHTADNPLFSGLELADGVLFGYDIDRMPRVPTTVVLSACEVGRSAVRWGEEAIGMTRAWLHAGARCVIAAPVVVADDDACELLGAMHEGLAAGTSPAEALADATERTGIVAPFQVHGAGF